MAPRAMCVHCWGASLDARKCRLEAAWQQPPLSPEGPRLVALPSGAKLRVLLTPPAAARHAAAPPLPTLLMAPDPPNTLETHAGLVAALAARGVRVATVELPGFGFSTPPPGFRFTPAAYAALVGELLDSGALGEEGAPVALALSCVAGLAARCLAAARPQQVAALVVIQTPDAAGAAAWAARADRTHALRVPVAGQVAMAAAHGAVIDSWFRAALAGGRHDALRPQLEAQAHAARRAGAHNSLASAFQALTHAAHADEHEAEGDGARLLDVPALVIWGAADRTHAATARGSALRGLRPGTRLLSLPSAGHFPELEATEAFCDAVAAFLREAVAAAARQPAVASKL